MTGPGPVDRLDPAADWFFMVGDLTALQAIAVNLEGLSASARGYLVLEVPPALEDEDDRLSLLPPLPSGLAVHWVKAGANLDEPDSNGAGESGLVAKVRDLPWLPGRGSFWAAGELSSMKALRAYWKGERGVSSEDMYLSSYWKRGASDEEHKAAKKRELV